MTEFVDIPWRDRHVRVECAWVGHADPQRPVVVFLHEGLGSVAMWRDFPATLCAALDARGLVYSRPGYGQSTPRGADERWGPDFMHQQALEVLPALLQAMGVDGVRQPLWLFGHSDGASIALIHAALASTPLRGVVAMAPHILVEDVSVQSIAVARLAYTQQGLRERLAKYHADVDSAFFGWNDAWLSPAFRTWSIEDALASIRCPVLAVQGLDDEYGTLEQVRGIARRVAHCDLLELTRCGHSPHRDAAERLLPAVQGFMRRHT